MSTKIDAVLFDLDGTLLNTLDDLTASANYALATCGYPTASRDLVRTSVGHGAQRLLCDLAGIPAPPQPDSNSSEAEALLSAFLEHYGEHYADATTPFRGVDDVMSRLHEHGVKVGVVSNKPDLATHQLCRQYFGALVHYALGSVPGMQRKPDPEPILTACHALGTDPAHIAYVGDSEPDVQVVQNAHIALGIAVTWGFRSRNQLEDAGATTIVGSADELWQTLLPYLR